MGTLTTQSAWPKTASGVSLTALSRLTGIKISNLSAYRKGTKPLYEDNRNRIALAAEAGNDSVIVRHGLASYPQLASKIAQNTHDPEFCVRLVKQTIEQLKLSVVLAADVVAFHIAPPTTHHHGWDALIAGVADLTWNETGMPGRLDWTRNPKFLLAEPWSPLPLGKRAVAAYLDTPISLRERNVILAAGNLESL